MKVVDILNSWSTAQKAGAVLPCPRCGLVKMNEDVYKNALSRRADIYICSSCGTEESIEDLKFSRNAELEHCKMPFERWFICSTVFGMTVAKGESDGDFEITVTRKVILAKEDIDDIVAGAFEGGINYWCGRAEIGEDTYYGEFASDQISAGGTLKLYDIETDEEYVLTLEKLFNGVGLACRQGYADGWFDGDRFDTMMIDAEDCDIIIQLALFGEVVYG